MHLKLWTYDIGDGDYFVAESAEEADKMYTEWAGHSLADEYVVDIPEWESLPSDKVITLTLEDATIGLTEGQHTFTVAEWIERAGPGYLFSMNYLP